MNRPVASFEQEMTSTILREQPSYHTDSFCAMHFFKDTIVRSLQENFDDGGSGSVIRKDGQ
jgi:hypothetical protein